MTDIADAKAPIQEEETQFRSALSEQLFQKVGGAINFINNRQYDKHEWNLNGNYSLGVGSSGLDGVFPFLVNVELTGFWYYADQVGSAGTTTIDVHRITGGGTDAGSIFTTLPSVDTTASSGSITVYNAVTSNFYSNPTGHSAAAIDTGETNPLYLNAGDALRLDLDSVMLEANNFQFGIFFRPR